MRQHETNLVSIFLAKEGIIYYYNCSMIGKGKIGKSQLAWYEGLFRSC